MPPTAETDPTGAKPVPLRALALSLAALAVPVIGALGFPERLGEYGALLWLLALVPAFLLAYYRGRRGVATALAAGMATLSVTQVVATIQERPIPDLLMGVVIVYVALALAIGWLAETLHHEKGEVEDLALTDVLTQLPNRRHARVFLENEFAAAGRGRTLSVILFDLDRFKDYNDRYGHAAGDAGLKAFADTLARTTRQMNLSARFGGEEFISVLAGTDAEGAMVFAERVRAGLREQRLEAGPLTVSAGVAHYHPRMRSPDELLAAADHALYAAKREGRNCVRLFGKGQLDRGLIGADGSGSPGRFPKDGGPSPGEAGELGESTPPITLQPHRITGFGTNRSALVVENDSGVRGVIVSYLTREGFEVVDAPDAIEGMRAFEREFDVLIVDVQLPGNVSGIDLLAAAKSRWPATQVVCITELIELQLAARAMAAGADRFLQRPFSMPELSDLLVDLLPSRDRVAARLNARSAVTPDAAPRMSEIQDAVVEGALALVRAVELREVLIQGRGDRVARYARTIAEHLPAGLGELDVDALHLGCRLHDIGKLSIPEPVVNKPDMPDTAEREMIRVHARAGREILGALMTDETVLAVVTWHHERWDGAGYPDGLLGGAIPLPARIAALADTFEAMTSPRAWRPPIAWDEAVRKIRDESGAQFDPNVVEAFEAGLPAILEVHVARDDL